MNKQQISIVREVQISGRESDIDMLIIETQLELEPDEYITLPLKKASMICYNAEGNPVKTLVSVIDTKKKIRVIKLN